MKPLRLAILLSALATPAASHHPGSHAARLPDGRVKLEVTTIGDGCTSMGRIAPGLPAGVAAPPAAFPVTARLARPQAAICTMIGKPVTGEILLDLPRGTATVHVFILDAEGAVRGTERVPVR